MLLGVNLGHYDPGAAAQEVRVARRELGGALLAVEIGNEPDAFIAHHLRARPWTVASYLAQVDAYRRAIATAAPGVLLAGPDAINPRVGRVWVNGEAAREHPALLTVHYYPLGSCAGAEPTISELLDPALGPAESAAFRHLHAVARRSAIPVRLGETNNIDCGGRPGVSDTFAAALWGLDYLVRAMAAGVDGLNLHGDLGRPSGYAPLSPATVRQRVAGRLQARPEWYALLAASRLRGDRPLGSGDEVASGLRGSVTVFARPHGGEDVVAVNLASPGDGARTLRVPVPAGFVSGTVLRLVGPSSQARDGVTLGSSAVSPDGSWRPRLPLTPVPRRGGFLVLSLAPSSAAVITLRAHP